MIRTSRLLATALGTAAVAATLVVAGSSGSLATTSGSLSFSPATGDDETNIVVTTAGACPQAATNLIVKVTGGDPADASSQVNGGVIVPNSAISAYQTANGGIVVPFTTTFHDFAANEGFFTLKGKYVFTLTCRTQADPASLLDYVGSLAWTPGAALRGTYAVAALATTTVLDVTPAAPVVQGTPVTLEATVSPNAAGTVQFKDGSANVGSPVTVASGVAELTTTALAAGTRSLTAVFTPSDAVAYSGSTSSPVSYQVTMLAPEFLPTVWPAPRVGVASSCIVSAANATTKTYAWLKNGVVIPNATGSSRTVPESEYGSKLSCRVTASNPDNAPIVATSGQSTVAVGPALRATAAPYLYGTVRAGSRVYCKPGTWSPGATSYLYRWRLDGKSTTSTASSIVPPSTWRGHLLSCAVTARRAAWTNGSAVSKAVKVA